jgi:hypothetical protein
MKIFCVFVVILKISQYKQAILVEGLKHCAAARLSSIDEGAVQDDWTPFRTSSPKSISEAILEKSARLVRFWDFRRAFKTIRLEIKMSTIIFFLPIQF